MQETQSSDTDACGIIRRCGRTGVGGEVGDDRPNLLRVTDNRLRARRHVELKLDIPAGSLIPVQLYRLNDCLGEIEGLAKRGFVADL